MGQPGGIVAENMGSLALYCESTMKAGTYENRAMLKRRYENRALLRRQRVNTVRRGFLLYHALDHGSKTPFLLVGALRAPQGRVQLAWTIGRVQLGPSATDDIVLRHHGNP